MSFVDYKTLGFIVFTERKSGSRGKKEVGLEILNFN